MPHETWGSNTQTRRHAAFHPSELVPQAAGTRVKMVSQSHVVQIESLRNMLLVEASLILNCLRQIPGRFIMSFPVGRCEFFRYQIVRGVFVRAD